MLNWWKRAIVGRPRQSRPPKVLAAPTDLANVPVLPVGDPRGLSAVDLSVMGHYLGRTVLKVEAFPGRRPTSEWKGTTTADWDWTTQAEPAEATTARDFADDSRTSRWRIHFADDAYADVRLRPVGVAGSEFPGLQARFLARQRERGGISGDDSIIDGSAGTVEWSPYQTYYERTVLAAVGSHHEAVVVATGLDTPRYHETMAGIAVLALRLIGE